MRSDLGEEEIFLVGSQKPEKTTEENYCFGKKIDVIWIVIEVGCFMIEENGLDYSEIGFVVKKIAYVF